jgi:hypothetical protein
MPRDFLEGAMLFLTAYPMLWVQSFDPGFRMRVYQNSDLDGPNQLVVDERPSYVSIGAIFWSCCFVALTMQSKAHCLIYAVDITTRDGATGALAIAVCGKCLFGAFGETHKRVLLSANQSLSRPMAWRALDLITPIQGNAASKLLSKLLWFPSFAALAWIFNAVTQRPAGSTLVVPEYVFLACAFVFLGRLATIYTKRNSPPLLATFGLPAKLHWTGLAVAAVLLACLVSFFLTYIQLESALRNCGAMPDVLPSILHLLVGLLSIPVNVG